MRFQRTVHRVLTAVARHVVVPAYKRRFEQFERLLHEARRVQHDILFGRLRRCRDTRFGRDLGLAEMHSLDDYRRRVPISRYDYFAPYISQVARGAWRKSGQEKRHFLLMPTVVSRIRQLSDCVDQGGS